MRVIAACGNGMGTSMLIRLKVEKILKKLNIPAKVEAMSAGQAKGEINNADIIICSQHLAHMIPTTGKAKVTTLINLMSEDEIEAALKKVL